MLISGKQHSIVSFYSLFWVPLIAVSARIHPSTADISYFIIAGYALLGKEQTIQALALLFLFIMINPEISPNANNLNLHRYVVIFSAFLSIFFRTSFLKYDSLAFYLLGFVVFIIIHSIFFSKFTDVSIFKIVNWIIVMITLLKAWAGLNELEYERTKKWIIIFFLFIVLISLFFLFIPEVGYAINASNFQGVLNHPQVFGVLVALIAAFVFGHFIEKNKFSWLLMGIFFLLCWLIFLSKSRTAILSLFIAIPIYLLLIFILNFSKKKISLSIFLDIRLFFILFLFLIFFLLFSSEIIEIIEIFFFKNDIKNFDSLLDIYFQSRYVLIEPMVENINKNFMTGIGFSISSDPLSMIIERVTFLNLPISAPTEKGIIYISILEELGIFGFILFIMLIFILFYKAIIYNMSSIIVFIVILLSNIGEATFFSIGGLGLLNLIFLTLIITRPKL